MSKREFEIFDLMPNENHTGSFTLVLIEKGGQTKIPIVIGLFEAQSIAIELEKITPDRPLTHDLFKSFSKAFDFTVDEVLISDLSEGIFYSKIICSDGLRHKNIDARASDAVSIALRFQSPIFVSEEVIKEAGIDGEEKESNPIPIKIKPTNQNIQQISVKELQGMLNEAIKNENYEKAAEIRDELDKRR